MINHTIDLNNVRFPSLQPHPITGVPFYTGSAQAIEINWAEPPPLQTVLDSFSSFSRGPEESIHPVDSVDFIFATDCVYDRNFHDMLLPTLLSLASPQTTVFFANVKRFKSDSKFWKKLGKKFLIKTLEIEPESGGKRGRGGVTIRVCTLKNTL
ncbi:hypothetical protein BLNAU_1886 [Blattamonas nauphoetae]|uniref:Methyltransferase n=1 Tax=Blattamonas nauphoetae TaxID=2049346 RepID=A0ABQ9YHV8_9EUKA|nr:hypothetical protein BLNAU_1886 [Blattamonas nauphoetae]